MWTVRRLGCDTAYRCRREGFGVSGDEDCGDLPAVQMPLSDESYLPSAMSLAIHLDSGRPNTWPLVPTAAVHSLPVLLAPEIISTHSSVFWSVLLDMQPCWERPVRTKSHQNETIFFDLTERKSSFWSTFVLTGFSFWRKFVLLGFRSVLTGPFANAARALLHKRSHLYGCCFDFCLLYTRELPCRIWFLLVKRYDTRTGIRRKNPVPHSRSLIGTDRDRSGTYDFSY